MYGEHPSPVPNSNHAWMARDDVTELYFRDLDHVLANMASPYVHEKVAPDAPLFADFETATVLLAREHSVPLAGQSGEEGRGAADKQSPPRDVALFFIAAPDGSPDGASLHAELMPLLTSALEEIASDAVCGLLVNIGFASDKLDVTKYYGGKDMPRYAVVYKIVMQNAASVASLRKAQAVFAQRAAGLFDDSVSYTLFGREALILDTTKGIRVRSFLLYFPAKPSSNFFLLLFFLQKESQY